MEVLVCGRCRRLAREAGHAGAPQPAPSGDQLAFSKESLSYSDEECRSTIVGEVPPSDNAARPDGAWLRGVRRPQVALGARISGEELAPSLAETKMDPATPARERWRADEVVRLAGKV